MKKLFALMLVMTMILSSFTGCVDKNPAEDTTKKDEVVTENGGDETNPTEEAVDTEDVTTEEEAKEQIKEDYSITVFIPNDNADGFNETEVTIAELNEKEILNQLILAGVLNEGTKINTFEKKVEDGKTYLVLDFNEKLADKLYACGSSGEYVTMGSIVNTFLKAYDAEYFKFTVNEEIFESGHIVYDEPMGFIES